MWLVCSLLAVGPKTNALFFLQDEQSHLRLEPWLFGLHADILVSDGQRLYKEATHIASCGHGNVVSVIGLVTTSWSNSKNLPPIFQSTQDTGNGLQLCLGYIMEYCDGGDLREWLER